MPLPPDARETGIIKSVTAKGYGFIRRPLDTHGNKQLDVFVHASECNNCFDDFRCGTKVEFGVGADARGRLEAKNVKAV